MPDLRGEYLAALHAPDADQIKWFRDDLDLPGGTFVRVGGLGVARVVPDVTGSGGGTYTPVPIEDPYPKSLLAVVQPVLPGPLDWGDGGRRVTPDAMAVLDLVAWDPRAPARFWTRLGAARWLGHLAVDKACADWWDRDAPPGPLWLFPHPLAWLKAGAPGDGAVPLDSDLDLRTELMGCARVLCADADFGAEIAKRLRRRPALPPIPKVLVRRAVLEAAEV